jgi:hypothetical protein
VAFALPQIGFNPSTIPENAAPYPAYFSGERIIVEQRPRERPRKIESILRIGAIDKGERQCALPFAGWLVACFVSVR